MVQRVLAVLAAVFLVGSVGVATLEQPDLPLGQVLFLLDSDMMNSLEVGTKRHFPLWVWNNVAVPLLVRPAWLIPAGAGIVCAGLAVTLMPSRGSPRPRRRN